MPALAREMARPVALAWRHAGNVQVFTGAVNLNGVARFTGSSTEVIGKLAISAGNRFAFWSDGFDFYRLAGVVDDGRAADHG